MDNLVTPKKMKFKINPEIEEHIQFHAINNMANLYDPKFSYEEQSTGFHAFRELVFIQSKVHPSLSTYQSPPFGKALDGSYLLGKLHFLIRQRALDCARAIRSKFKIFNDD